MSAKNILQKQYLGIRESALNRIKEPHITQLRENVANNFLTLTDEQSKLLLANLLYPNKDDSITKTNKYISNFKRSLYLATVSEFSGPAITHKLLEGHNNYLILNNNLSEYIQTQGDFIRDCNDLSWHSSGAEKIKDKEKRLLKATNQLKSNFKRKKLGCSFVEPNSYERGL